MIVPPGIWRSTLTSDTKAQSLHDKSHVRQRFIEHVTLICHTLEVMLNGFNVKQQKAARSTLHSYDLSMIIQGLANEQLNYHLVESFLKVFQQRHFSKGYSPLDI